MSNVAMAVSWLFGVMRNSFRMFLTHVAAPKLLDGSHMRVGMLDNLLDDL